MQFLNKIKLFYLRVIKRIFLPRDLIRVAISRNKNKIAITENGKSFTYQEVYNRGKKLANSFKKNGLNKGDKIALFLYNCKEYFEIRIATYLSGIVLTPLVPDTSIEDVIFILNDCNVKALIYNEDLFDVKIKENTKIKKFISLEKDYEPFIALGGLNEIKISLEPDDLASINFSSGTTARPKGIMLMQKSWVNSFYGYVLNSPRALEGNIKMLHILSLATSGGAAFLPVLFLGAENFFLDKFDEEKIVIMIKNEKIDIIFITPSWLNILIDYCKYNKIKLHLKNIVIGTEPISREKFKEAIEFFGPIIQSGYGMAEVLPPLSLICSKDYIVDGKISEELLGFAGKPVTGVEIKIIDRMGKIGKIAVRSPTISAGYWNNPELNKKYFKDEWFLSDDYGYINKDGYLYISGRAQDIIEKDSMIFSRDIEETLHSYPDVLEVFVFKNNAEIFAFVSFKKGSKVESEKGLQDFCGKNVRLKNKINIIVFPRLPIRLTGKIDKRNLREKRTQLF